LNTNPGARLNRSTSPRLTQAEACGLHPGAASACVSAGRRLRGLFVACGLAASLLSTGCRQDMHDQPRFKPYAKSDFFADKRSARPLVDGTIARGHLREDAVLYTGKAAGKPANAFPFPVTADVMARGRERFDIFCSPCHGRTGAGDGMIVQRGYRKPPTFHQDRLRQAAPGYTYDVITNGFGAMPDYAQQIPVRDRWAIVAYITALQRSQHAAADRLPAEARAALDAADKR
jgi:mono/diheme cytochrome c family protein